MGGAPALPGRRERWGAWGAPGAPGATRDRGAPRLRRGAPSMWGAWGAPGAPHAVMKRYALRRVALTVPTLFFVSVIVFLMMRMMPGDVAMRMVEGHAYAP